MHLAYLLLLTGLTISAVAIYYSVVGLAAIFAAASVPIIIMGTTLELAKLVCASWLKANWPRIPNLMKLYMTTAVVVLMAITSMGIFGFLSKAHLDQAVPTGDVAAQVAMFDEKINTQKEIINDNRAVLRQLDEAVNQTMGRSTSEQGAERSVAIRRGQAKERAQANKAIDQAQAEVSKLLEQKAPVATKLRAVEAEVGPIKYIAAFVYGDNPDANILEKAVTWVIIIIVSVFDPLAVIMLLAAQMTFGWHRKGHDPLEVEETRPEPDVDNKFYRGHKVSDALAIIDEQVLADKANELLAEIEKEPETEVFAEPVVEEVTINEVEQELERGEELLQAEEEIPSQLDTERPGDYVVQDDPKKKELHDEGLSREDIDQEHRVAGYIQNSEQTKSTLWKKINQRAGFKPIDELYKQYDYDKFAGLHVDADAEPELAQFIESSKNRARFNNYKPEKLEYFARRIYELREDNSNNTAG